MPNLTVIQRKGTESLLKVLGEDVVLTRYVKTRTASGGFTEGSPTPLSAQRFIIENADEGQMNVSASRNVEGQANYTRLLITGRFDADIQAGDTFVWDGNDVEVTRVSPDNQYETVAEGVIRG